MASHSSDLIVSVSGIRGIIGAGLSPAPALAFAQALGVRAVRFDDPAALAAFDWGAEWRTPEPLLVELIVDPAVVPPILSRTRVLGLTERVT